MTRLRKLRLRFSSLAFLVVAVAPFAAGCAASESLAPAVAPSAPAAIPAGAPLSPSAAESTPHAAPVSLAPSTAAASAKEPAAAAPAGATKAKSTDSPKLDDGAKPLLVYEGAMGVEVEKDHFPAAIEHAIDVAESLNGYLVSRTDTKRVEDAIASVEVG